MILDTKKGFGHAPARYDICIVGAGAAGISLALQFESTHFRVCLLDAGGRRYEKATQELFRGETGAGKYPELRDTRMGALGGSTNVWAGWCRPLEEHDFASRDGDSTDGWPFGFGDLLPFYRRAHEICGLGKFEYDPARWEGVLGKDQLLADDPGFTNSIFHVNGQRFGERFYDRLRHSKNIDLVLHAPVMRVTPKDGTEQGVRLEIRTLDRQEPAIDADYAVLAAGGIENARLLLLSAASPAEAPGNGYGLVGRFFTDHPYVDPGSLVMRGSRFSPNFYLPKAVASINGGTSVRGVLSLRPAVLERERLLNAALFFYPRYESHRAFATAEVKAFLQVWAKFGKRAVPGNVAPYLARAARGPHWVALALLRKVAIGHGAAKRWRMRAVFESESRFENRVTLAPDTDRIGRRRPHLEWQLSERDVSSMRRVIQLFDHGVRRAGIGHLERAFPDDPAAWRQAVEAGKHHIGTTRMNADPRHGVVDENCKVHGTTNLFICGSSVFPSSGYANPTLTIVALAARLGDHLKRLPR